MCGASTATMIPWWRRSWKFFILRNFPRTSEEQHGMPDETIIKTAEGNLVDEVYSSPVDEWQHRARGLILLTALAGLVLIAIYVVWDFGRDRTRDYSDIQEHFKYGSIG